jgi:hypothetical protein
MPAIEAQARGAEGTGHGADYKISDQDRAYIAPAKLAAMTIVDLLSNKAAGAQRILKSYTPQMSKEEYLEFMRGIYRLESWDGSSQQTM